MVLQKKLTKTTTVHAVTVPKTRTDFWSRTVPVLLQHVWTVLASIGWYLDDEAVPILFPLHNVTSCQEQTQPSQTQSLLDYAKIFHANKLTDMSEWISFYSEMDNG